MYHKEFDPPEELKKLIKCFWYDKRESNGQPLQFDVQPDSYTEIIFYFGDTCNLYEGGKLIPLPSPFIMALLNNPVNFYTEGGFEAICVRCYPWMIFDMLELPPDKTQVQRLDRPIAELQPVLEALITNGRIEDAVNELEKFFLSILPHIPVNEILSKAGAAITSKKGTMPVNKVADEAFATVRTLERTFKKSSGYTVKDVSGLMRFEQVRNCLWNHPDTNLAALAHEVGYTDQAHLSREFKRYAGTTPAAFARSRSKIQRDNNGG